MKGRLILAIASTILEEGAIVVIVLWGLPRIDIMIPFWGLAFIMIGWAAYSIFTFRLGTTALMREHVVGLPNMIGTVGKATNSLAPEGLVKIHGEFWIAISSGRDIKNGKEITVVGQDRLKLVVDESAAPDRRERLA